MQPRRDIDDYCYKGNRKLKEPVLPPNCKIVGREAFANSQIRKLVTFPETLEEIREGAFSEIVFLKKLSFLHPWKVSGRTVIKTAQPWKQ